MNVYFYHNFYYSVTVLANERCCLHDYYKTNPVAIQSLQWNLQLKNHYTTQVYYVTGFAKTVPNGARIEISFIAWHES